MKSTWLLTFAALWIALGIVCAPVRADERFRPMSPAQLPVNSTSDTLYHVPNALVAYANYDLIRRDFKQTEHMNNDEIDHWILENFAYVSEGQLKLRGLWTTDFQVDMNKTKLVHRPPNYTRSGMVEAEGGGMVDIKGIGYPPGEKLERALKKTAELREGLAKARQELADAAERFETLKNRLETDPEDVDALAAKTRLEEAQKKVGLSEAYLTHIDGSMRFGEGIAETHKQMSLQQSANKLNAENNVKYPDPARIETVETYFDLHLPWKVKNNLGTGEETICLYGRQPTAGHGTGSDVDPDIAYNPAPGAGKNPGPEFKRFNALQISNSGAIFDYGAIVVTSPEARALHGYTHYTQDAIDRGAFFDLYDSKINHAAYDLARDMDAKPDPWSEKRQWFLQQSNDFVPLQNVSAAPLRGTYRKLVELYQSATSGKFTETDARQLLGMISVNNKKNLGKSFADNTQQRRDRIEHLTLQTVLSGLDSDGARKLVQAAEGAGKTAELKIFMNRTRAVVQNHTEGMGDVPVQPTYALWEAMRQSKEPSLRTYGMNSQLIAIAKAQTGQGNSLLENRFIQDLTSDDFQTRKIALDSLYSKTGEVFDKLKTLVTKPDVQAALKINLEKNEAYERQHPVKSVFQSVDDQKKRANALIAGNTGPVTCLAKAVKYMLGTL